LKSRLDTILETVQSILFEVLDTPQRREQVLKAAKKAIQRADTRTLDLAKKGYGVGENPPEHEFIRQNDARYYRMKDLVRRLQDIGITNENVEQPEVQRLLDQIAQHDEQADKIYDRGGDASAAKPHIEAMQALRKQLEIVRNQNGKPISSPSPTPKETKPMLKTAKEQYLMAFVGESKKIR
jgi:hypothetical protein